jgi:hypothetical protein
VLVWALRWFCCHVVGAHEYRDENGYRPSDLPRFAKWHCKHCGTTEEDWVW